MTKRFFIVLLSVLLISLTAFGMASASGNTGWYQPNTWENPWNYSCWNSGDWSQCYTGYTYNDYYYNDCSYNYYWNTGWNNCYTYTAPAICASFVSDVTIPDGSYVAPGSAFTKTWRVTNNGTTTWNTNYRLVFVSGSQLSAPSAIALPYNVAPGQSVDLSVNMVAPTAGGIYKGYWKLQTDTGQQFGVGSNCNVSMWVQIRTTQPSYCGNYCCYPNNWYCQPNTVPSTPKPGEPMDTPAWPTWPSW